MIHVSRGAKNLASHITQISLQEQHDCLAVLSKGFEELEEMSKPDIQVGPHLPRLLSEKIIFNVTCNLDCLRFSDSRFYNILQNHFS